MTPSPTTLPDLPSPPFLSQWGDLACNEAVIERGADPAPLHDWRADGYLSPDDYRWWSRQTCGLACLQMTLASCPARWPRPPRKAALLADAVAHGVLTPNDDGTVGGLYYAPFVRWVAEAFGLEAVSRPELPLDELAARVASGAWLAMASVSYEIRLPDEPPTHTGGHLVLVHRVEVTAPASADDAPLLPEPFAPRAVRALVFHNPSGLPERDGRASSAADARCTPAQFARFYAGRGILVRRP